MLRIRRFSKLFVLLGLASLGYALNENDPCINPAGIPGQCIYLRDCKPLMKIYNKAMVTQPEIRFLEDSRCGTRADRKPLLCCATISSLPKAPFCGVTLEDRIVGGQVTNLDEYPWTGLIQYRKSDGRTEFRCGASLINSRYVVTAGHCINPRNWEIIGVRLGEWDLNSERDCVDGECAYAPVDMGVEKIILHEDYSPQLKAQHNDIALIRFTRDVNMTMFIAPVCLPIDSAQRTHNIIGTNGVAVGWGLTEDNAASNVKLKVGLEFKELQSCARIYRPTGIILADTQMCAGGIRGKDTCTGDSGGPLMKQINATFYLYGVISFGPSKCGMKGVPGIYTNVVKYIDWIKRNIE